MVRILLLGSSEGLGLTFYYTRLAIVLTRLGNDVILLSGEKEQYLGLAKELDKFNIEHVICTGFDRFDMSHYLKNAKKLINMLRNEIDINLILGGGVKQGPQVFSATRNMSHKPLTLAPITYLPSNRIGMTLARLSYGLLYDGCVALCDYSKNILLKSGVTSHNIVVAPLFSPDLLWFDCAKNNHAPIEDYGLFGLTRPVIFYAASHFRNKGFQTYLKAASEVLKKYDATFVVGGSGPLLPFLKNLASELKISENVIFTGQINICDMPNILCYVPDICVSTSLQEQLPSFVLECMAANQPIVASSVGGVPEVVENGVNGLLVRQNDSKSASSCIIKLIENPVIAKEMGLKGRKIVEARFNSEKACESLMKTFIDRLRD